MQREIKPGVTISFADEDADIIMPYAWQVSRGYPIRKERHGTDIKMFYAHHEIYKKHYGAVDADKIIDHKDTNKLNLHYDNLRQITQRENVQNSSKRKSIYPGVSSKPCRGYQYWIASVYINKIQVYLGSKHTELEAFATYKLACAILNFNVLEPFNSIDCRNVLSMNDIVNVVNNVLAWVKPELTLLGHITQVLASLTCCTERGVGTIIVNKEMSKVLSVGINGDGIECKHVGAKCTCCHSEVVALSSNNVGQIKDKVVIQSLSPCPDCAKSIVQSGVSMVYYLEQWKRTEGLDILDAHGIKHKLLEVILL